MFYNLFEVFVLSVVQGISEFLPVSSSAHLFLISEIYQFNSQSLSLDVGLHLGSLLAIILYFKSELFNIFNDRKLLLLIVFGSLPLIIIGLIVFKTGIINFLRNIEIIAWVSLIFAFVLFWADKIETKKKIETNLNIKNILIIGVFQILALIPGVSRSGIVITIGRFLKFNRVDSTKISFYLSIPAIAGASFLSLNEIASQKTEFNILILLSIIFSFIFSFLTIKYFLIYVKNFSLNIFVVYRILLSLILFYFIYA